MSDAEYGTGSVKRCTLCGEEKPLYEYSPNGPRLRARCKPCRSRESCKYVKANATKVAARLRRWRAERPEVARAIVQRYAKAHPEQKRAGLRRWRRENPDQYQKTRLAWDAANKHRKQEHKARRRAATLAAMPQWADRKAIAKIYAEAIALTKRTGVPHEVDHIVPLQGEFVRGLHWEGNLQIVTRWINRSKGRTMHG